jgi:hypothetical protein
MLFRLGSLFVVFAALIWRSLVLARVDGRVEMWGFSVWYDLGLNDDQYKMLILQR